MVVAHVNKISLRRKAACQRPYRQVTTIYAESILPFDEETAHVWGRLRVRNPENPLDEQIAATALIHDLTVVPRNTGHYTPTGARLRNPFA
jgi:toxin FitB